MSVLSTKVLLATDGSDEGKLATQAATELFKETGPETHVVSVVRNQEGYPSGLH